MSAILLLIFAIFNRIIQLILEMLAILLNILKFIPEKIWYGIFNILFDKNTYQNRRHFVRTCIIFIFIGILGIACVYFTKTNTLLAPLSISSLILLSGKS